MSDSAHQADSGLRRGALARSICARLCDERRTENELIAIDRELMRIERDARDPGSFAVYIAAASSDMERVQRSIASAREAGIEIVCTWPTIVTAVGDANPHDASRDARFGWSSQDLAEVDQADLLWFLVPSSATTRGAWIEAGFAFCAGKHLVFSGENTKQSVFCALGEEFSDDVAALSYICRVAQDRASIRAAIPDQTRAGEVVDGLRELAGAPITVAGFIGIPGVDLEVPTAPIVRIEFDMLDDRFDDGGEE